MPSLSLVLCATAMGIHGLVRATEDVDLLIRATGENVARLKQADTSISTRMASLGVQKFRSIEEAQDARDKVTADNAPR